MASILLLFKKKNKKALPAKLATLISLKLLVIHRISARSLSSVKVLDENCMQIHLSSRLKTFLIFSAINASEKL